MVTPNGHDGISESGDPARRVGAPMEVPPSFTGPKIGSALEPALVTMRGTLQQHALLLGTCKLLKWDAEQLLPASGKAFRTEQVALMEGLMHRELTARPFVDAVRTLEGASYLLSPDDQVNVREVARQLQRKAGLPVDHVAGKAQAQAACVGAWAGARASSDFSVMAPLFTRFIDYLRREADLIGYAEHPYDVSIQNFEPGMTYGTLKPLILGLADKLKKIGDDVEASGLYRRPDAPPISLEIQERLCRRVFEAMNIPSDSIRLDRGVHPYMREMGPFDIRITNRFEASNPLACVIYTIHEAGHGLYQLQLPSAHFGTPRGQVTSIGIDESQAAIFDGEIARNDPFFGYLTTLLVEFGAPAFYHDPANVRALLSTFNRSPIRVQADEITYCSHIAVRMLLEEGLITGAIPVRDLPARWAELYELYVGVTPKTDAEGVLQDVHWFTGSIGNFASYGLGRLYAAQFAETLRIQDPQAWTDIGSGSFTRVNAWLAKNIHGVGMSMSAPELVEKVTGKPVGAEAFFQYLQRKFRVT